LQPQRRMTRHRPAEADFDVVWMRAKDQEVDHFRVQISDFRLISDFTVYRFSPTQIQSEI